MKARVLLITILLTVFIPVMNAPAQSKGREKMISASLSVKRNKIFHNEPFKIKLVINTKNLRLGDKHQLSSLPQQSVLKLGDYIAKPTETKLNKANMDIFEKHVYVYDADAVSPGKVVLSPKLNVIIISDVRTFYGRRTRRMTYTVPVTPLTLNVVPLPQSPGNFSGAIGKLSFDVDIDPVNLSPGDIIKATMKVSGHGYLKKVTPPAISPGRNFKAYNTKRLKNSPADTAIFEQVLIPQSTNATVIPAVDFTYFNPDQARYVTSTDGPFKLTFQEKKTETVEYFRPAEEPPPETEKGESKIKQSEKIITSNGESIKKKVKSILNGTYSGNEAVIIADSKARLAPSLGALVMFELPQGASVIITSEYRNWAEVYWKNNRGWIPKRDLKLP